MNLGKDPNREGIGVAFKEKWGGCYWRVAVDNTSGDDLGHREGGRKSTTNWSQSSSQQRDFRGGNLRGCRNMPGDREIGVEASESGPNVMVVGWKRVEEGD